MLGRALYGRSIVARNEALWASVRGVLWAQFTSATCRELPHLPALGMSPRREATRGMVFVAGEAEVDEPLAVEGAGHRLQNPDAPLAVLDQLVVGRQDARDPPLHRQRGNADFTSLCDDGDSVRISVPLAELNLLPNRLRVEAGSRRSAGRSDCGSDLRRCRALIVQGNAARGTLALLPSQAFRLLRHGNDAGRPLART